MYTKINKTLNITEKTAKNYNCKQNYIKLLHVLILKTTQNSMQKREINKNK